MAAILTIEGLQKSFPSGRGQVDVLRGVDLSVERGESVSIRGESGCGKTTLLNLIAGLEKADRGVLRWRDSEVTALSNDGLARMRAEYLGMVFQAYLLAPELNALENVVLAARVARTPLAPARKRARELLERVGLAERIEALPATLSGGERQRVAVARALINQPALVLADEPTGNLDETTSDDVLNLLLEVTRDEGASLLLVTHNRQHAARTDRAMVLRGGALETAPSA